VWDNPTVHFTSGATTLLGRGGGVRSHHADYSPPPPACSLNFDQMPASMGESVSSLSQSQSTRSAKRRAAEDAWDGALRKPARCKKVAPGPDDDEDDDNDRETDVIPTTDKATVRDTSTVEERRAAEQMTVALIKALSNEFMKRAFPPREILIGIPQLTAAGMITMCRSQKDLDYIAIVVRHWELGVKIIEMEPGYEKNRLIEFHRKPPNGSKFMNSCSLEVIHLPDGDPRTVVRRLEKNNKGKVVPG
jgi:hypothetical protein